MRWLCIIIVACLALTLLKVAIVVLLVVLALAIVWGVLFRPAETFGLLAFMILAGLLQTHTLAMLILIGFRGFIALMKRRVKLEEEVLQPPLLLRDVPPEEGPGHRK